MSDLLLTLSLVVIAIVIVVVLLSFTVFEAVKWIVPILAIIGIIAEAIGGIYCIRQVFKEKRILAAITGVPSTLYCMYITYLVWIGGGIDKIEGIENFLYAVFAMMVISAPFMGMLMGWIESFYRKRKEIFVIFPLLQMLICGEIVRFIMHM